MICLRRSAVLVLLSAATAGAFAPTPLFRTGHAQLRSPVQVQPNKRVPTHLGAFDANIGGQILEAAAENTKSFASSPLFEFFMQTLITNGVPAFFVIVTLGFVFTFISRRSNRDFELDNDSIIAELYGDLYGGQSSQGRRNNFFPMPPGGKKLPRNLGIPKNQYLKISNINQKYDSYEYSVTAATKSKAAAAASYRGKAFDRALRLVLQGDEAEIPRHVKAKLLGAEKDFLKNGSKLLTQLQYSQTVLAQQAIDTEIKNMGRELKLDPIPLNNTEIETLLNETAVGSAVTIPATSIKIKENPNKSKLMQSISKIQRELMQLELNFVAKVIAAVGPERALGVRTALVGDIAARGTGALLSQLEERPLSVVLESLSSTPKNIYVARFPGDTTASQVANLREEVTAIVRNAKPGDEVLLVLQTGGGTVTGYGLAAAQLIRLKEAGLKLTIAVEQVAASGGYMMCCIADHIVASPFAVLGSIGVISDIPNVYERLKKEGIEFQTVTAGKFKRTLTPTKKVTREDFEKSKEDVEEILVLFRDFVKQNRPQLEIEKIATGETWFGTAALEKGLCDEIKTVDDVITEFVDQGCNVYEVEYSPPIEINNLPFAFAGAETSDDADRGILRRAVRWVVQTIADEVRAEIGNAARSGGNDSIERRYMARDDSVDRTFFK